MRMDKKNNKITAKKIINEFTEKKNYQTFFFIMERKKTPER